MTHLKSLFNPFSLNLNGQLISYSRPQIMAILNVTPDSFYSGSRNMEICDIEKRVAEILDERADFIDIGAYSTRPGADDVREEEEIRRLRLGLKIIREQSDNIPVSVDTFRSKVARIAIEECGAQIINDVSGGLLDKGMLSTVSRMKVPYILTHMRGTPNNMQSLTDYSSFGDVTTGVINELWDKVEEFKYNGVADIIIDPGFGFAKTVEQNYKLLSDLPAIAEAFNLPLLIGVSRKSMIYRPLHILPEDSLPGSIALATAAMERGASFIRVHDVSATRQALQVVSLMTGDYVSD